MNFEIDQNYAFYGRIDQVNSSTYDTYPANVTSEDGEKLIVRLPIGQHVLLNKIYYFETVAVLFKEKIHLRADKAQIINELSLNDDRKEQLMRAFYAYAPVNLKATRHEVETRLEAIENPIIKAITKSIYHKYENDFYLYPAATKFHHAYISGLAYHTVSMLKLAEGFLSVYSFLNRDLVVAGILLHDIGKVLEFDTFEGSEYTIKGRLVGHITLGANEIALTAKELGYEESEEAMLLSHIMISHHYHGNFGSPKRPNIAEALVVYFVDTIDSKICDLGEELDVIKLGESTAPIGVLDKERYYKHKLSKE
ncbi:MAG: HD domain-containing protein [Candidatus Izemoplasmatales bacterium]|jgi:3'-5' exoribonuclease|nr:HD domain-containing protein [Candidatus Izemoplasmatales bacterium]